MFDLYYIMGHLKINLFNDLEKPVTSFEIFSLSIKFDQESKKTVINLSDLIAEDFTPSNNCSEKVILHVGNLSVSDKMFYDLSKINIEKSLQDCINKSFIESENEIENIAPKLDQSFFEKSLFNIKKNLKNVFSYKSKKLNKVELPTLPDPSVTVTLDVENNLTNIVVKKVFILWNNIFFKVILEYFSDLKENIIPNIEKIVKTESHPLENIPLKKSKSLQPDFIKRTKNQSNLKQSFMSPSNFKSNRTSTNNDLNKETSKKTFIPSEINLKLEKLIFFNFIKAFFQTEIIFDNFAINLKMLQDKKTCEVFCMGLSINDLTCYPFTKPFYDLRDYKNLKRNLIAQMKVPNSFVSTESIVKDQQILDVFRKNSLYVTCEILNPEKAILLPSKIKIKAKVYINNLQINYYQQLIFRLIDLINVNIIPFILPEEFPKTKEDIFKKMTDFFRTVYSVSLYNTSLFLKPSYLFKHYIQLRVLETLIHNEVMRDKNERDLSGKNREFYVESIFIELNKLFWGGYDYSKESTLSNSLKVTFTRFLFQQEVKAFYGKDDFLNNVFFGNEIDIKSESIHLSLFKNDFMFFMTVLFNNINFDDNRSSDYVIEEIIADDYSNPMTLSVNFDNLFVYFRYDKPNEKPKVFCVFSLPGFYVKFEKNKQNVKQIRVSSNFLKASAFEILIDYKESLLSIPFIAPIIKTTKVQTEEFGIDLIKDSNDRRDKMALEQKLVKTSSQGSANNTIFVQSQTPINLREEIISNKPRRIRLPYDNFFYSHEEHNSDLFILNVKIDANGNETGISIKNHNIILIQSVFLKLIEFTKMTDEMSINTKMQPLLESVPSNLDFKLLLLDTIISLPFDEEKFAHPVQIFIGECQTIYSKIIKKHTPEMVEKIHFFKRMPKSPSSNFIDHSLSMFENSYNMEKFVVFENLMSVKLKSMHIFVTDEPELELVLTALSEKRLNPNFGDSNFVVQIEDRQTQLRFISFDMVLQYSITTYYSNNYKWLTLSEGTLSNQNLTFALSSYDINFLSSMNNSLTKFGFDTLVFDGSAQKEMEQILLKNFNLNGNEYFYSIEQAITKQRKFLIIQKLNLRILILDDIFGTMGPIFDLCVNIEPTNIYKTHIFDDYFKAEISLEANYLNTGIRVWEPIFENFNLIIEKSFIQRTNDDNLMVTTANKSSCLNISSAMLDNITYIQKNLAIGKTLTKQMPEFEQSMYNISNQTGKTLEIFVVYADEVITRFSVKDGQTKKILNLSKNLNNKRNLRGVVLEIFSVEEEDQLPQISSDLDINDKVQEFLINGERVIQEKTLDNRIVLHRPVNNYFNSIFHPKMNERRQTNQSESNQKKLRKSLLISVQNPLSYFSTTPFEKNGYLFYRSFQNTQIVLTISSRYLVKNISSIDFIIKFFNGDKTNHKVLMAGTSLNISTEYEKGGICVSEKSISSELPRFSEIIDLNLENVISDETIQPEINAKSIDFHEFWIHFDKRNILVKIKSNSIRHEIIFAPSVILENRTFRRLYISDADGQGFDVVLNKHDVNYFVYFQIKEIINLKFKFANLKSEVVSFQRSEFLKKPFERKFWLMNEEGLPIVKIYLHVPKSDSLRLIFYHKNILLNETFVNWWFSQNLRFREIRNAILLPEIDDCPQILFVKHKTPLLFAAENNQSHKIKLDVSKAGPTFYEIETFDRQKYEFTITLESKMVSDFADITQNIVHFVPKYVFINKTKNEVIVSDISKSKEIKVNALSRKAISFFAESNAEHFISLRFLDSEWSEPVPSYKSAFYFFSVHNLTKDKLFLINLEINFSNNSYYIVLLESELGCCCFENFSKQYDLLIFQDQSKINVNTYDMVVLSDEKRWYAWRYPLFQTEFVYVVIIVPKTKEIIGQFMVKMNKPSTRQLLKIKNEEYFVETYQKGFATHVQFLQSSMILLERFPKQLSCTSKMNIFIEELGLSIICGEKNERREFLYIDLSNVKIRSIKNDRQTEYHFLIGYFSIDFNSKLSAVFPVLFVPRYNRQILESEAKTFLQLHIVKKNDSLGMNVFENLSLEMYPCVLKIEEDFLVHAIRFYTEITKNSVEMNEYFSKKNPVKIKKFNVTDSLKKNWKVVQIEETRSVFFQITYLSKMEIICSFRKSLESRQNNNHLSTYLNLQNAIGAFLITIDDLPLTLPEVRLNHDSKSIPVLKELIIDVYKTVFFNTIFKFVASSNILGNPLSFYNEIKLGVDDLLQKENTAIRNRGIVGGTESFMKHVMVGTTGTINKMTRTMGDGLSALTIDNEYLLKRERLFSKSENKFLIGLKQFGYGLYDGLRGFFVKPIEGGKQDGFTGVMKGAYQGISGLVLKPITGMLDLTSATADGIRELFIDKSLQSSDTRTRPPRAFYTSKHYYKQYEVKDAKYNDLKISKEGYQLVLIEEINFHLEKLVICLEGIIIMDEKDIIWRKPVENLIGSVSKDSVLTIEYFDLMENQIVLNTRLIDYMTEKSGQQIVKAIEKIIDNFNQKTKHDESNDSIMSGDN